MNIRRPTAFGFVSCLFAVTVISIPACADNPDIPKVAREKISAVIGADLRPFQIRKSHGFLLAANPSQKFSCAFSAEGIRIRTANWVSQLRLSEFDLDNAFPRASAHISQVDSNRVEYHRGQVTEWYINGPLGLEQGFTVNTPPAASVRTLLVKFAFSGDLAPVMRQSDKVITLLDKRGRSRLTYSDYHAYDASGRELPLGMALNGSELTVRVDSRAAEYPVTIDPIIQLAELTPSNPAAMQHFASSVAVSGSTIVVGAPGTTANGVIGGGAAYVFVKPSTGWQNMTETARLTASDATYTAGFGNSVAISSSTIVVGAPAENIGSHALQGAAYVFVMPSTGWTDMTQTAKLTSSDGGGDDLLGASVSISGNVIVAGAQRNGINGDERGAAYVFVKPSTGWTNMVQTAKLTPSNPVAYSEFGNSVAISGPTIVVGEHYDSLAYVFVRPTTGWHSMHDTAQLSASDRTAGDQFGYSTAVSGGTVLVGAVGISGSSGAAYVFVQPSTGWKTTTETAKLTPSDGHSGDAFGSAVSTNGSVVLVGSMLSQTNGVQTGAAYKYVKPLTGWATTAKFNKKFYDANGATDYLFGASVKVGGGVVLVGAPYTVLNSTTEAGAAFIFHP